MSFLNTDVLDNIAERCENLIQDVKSFAEKLGCDYDVQKLTFDFEEAVLDQLDEDGIDVHDMTNDIICACFRVTQDALDHTQLCDDFGLTFEHYVNGEDSHLYFIHDGSSVGAYEGHRNEYKNEGDINSLLDEALSFIMTDIVCDCLVDANQCSWEDLHPNDEHDSKIIHDLRECIAEDIYYNNYDHADIAACYGHELTGSIKEMAESFVADLKQELTQKQTKSKPSVERD